MNLQKRSLSPGLRLWATTGLIAPILVIGEVTPQSFLNPHLLNLFAAVVVFIQGLAALTAIWRMERSNAHGTIPFAWAFFAVQHLAFGFGALLIVVFDDDYYYGNELGTYAFSGSVLPLLLVQFVAMSMAMLGVWLATGRRSWWVRKPAACFRPALAFRGRFVRSSVLPGCFCTRLSGSFCQESRHQCLQLSAFSFRWCCEQHLCDLGTCVAPMSSKVDIRYLRIGFCDAAGCSGK